MSMKRRPPPDVTGTPQLPPWDDAQFMEDYPSIHSFLSDTTYDDGKSRATGSITLFTQLGALKASVSDKDRGVVAYLSATTVDELLVMIELGIETDKLEWRSAFKDTVGKKVPY